MKTRTNGQENGIWMGYDILAGRGVFPRPEKIVFWNESRFKHVEPEEPFHYHADALVGLSTVHLNKALQNPFVTPKMNYSFAFEAWQALEPHHELYTRAQPRVHALRESMKTEAPSEAVTTFERRFLGCLEEANSPEGFDLLKVADVLEAIEHLENVDERPLLYNFRLRFSREVMVKMHYLHSMLFNLRALLAMDYNAHMQDPTHEAVKVDSISDYLPKAEYVANDALLYYTFKRCRDEIPAGPAQKMEQAFFTYSHNGAVLIENLPKSFLKKLSAQELEESLYLVQMDWLLGSEAGLLFRLREELYGLTEGYEKIFYPELHSKGMLEGPLSINCQISHATLYPSADAA